MPALGGRQPYSVSLRDYSGETKAIQLFTGEITAGSLPALLTQLGAFDIALQAVILGVRARTQWGEETIVSNARAAVKDAQIETEMLVRVQGAVTQKPWSFRIPTVNYTAFNYADPPAGDAVILSGAGATAATIALIDALELTFKMPDDETEGIVVVGMNVVR